MPVTRQQRLGTVTDADVDVFIENLPVMDKDVIRQRLMNIAIENENNGLGIEGAIADMTTLREELEAGVVPKRKQRIKPLGALRDADVDVFIKSLMPGISDAEIKQFNPENRALIRQGLMDIATDNYNNGLGVQGAIAELQMVRDVLAAADTQRQVVFSAEDQGGKNVNLRLLGIASFTIIAVMTGLMASGKMKKLYDDFMDDLNTRFPAPEWPDDAPDTGDAIPFYNTETLKKLVGMYNSVSSNALSYLTAENSLEEKGDEFFPAPEWKDDAPDPDNVVQFYNSESIAKASAYLKDGVDKVAEALAKLAGISSEAYVHYKSIIEKQLPFPPLLNFGTHTGQRVDNPTVDLAPDFTPPTPSPPTPSPPTPSPPTPSPPTPSPPTPSTPTPFDSISEMNAYMRKRTREAEEEGELLTDEETELDEEKTNEMNTPATSFVPEGVKQKIPQQRKEAVQVTGNDDAKLRALEEMLRGNEEKHTEQVTS